MLIVDEVLNLTRRGEIVWEKNPQQQSLYKAEYKGYKLTLQFKFHGNMGYSNSRFKLIIENDAGRKEINFTSVLDYDPEPRTSGDEKVRDLFKLVEAS